MKKLGKPEKVKQVYDWDNNLKTITSQEVLEINKRDKFIEEHAKPIAYTLIASIVMWLIMLGVILCM